MTEWGVVGVIVVLIGLLAAVLPPVVKINTSQTRTAVLLDETTKRLEGLDTRTEELSAQVNRHETRITVLENEKGGRRDGCDI